VARERHFEKHEQLVAGAVIDESRELAETELPADDGTEPKHIVAFR
jgi:hypothetical protein